MRFVDDYANDPMAASITFGLEVDGKRWHVTSEAGEAGTTNVTLHSGFPEMPIFYYTTSAETLGQIDAGMLSGLTAMGAATSDQVTPLDVLFTDGYIRPADYDAVFRTLTFHFWNRGNPETAPLAIQHSRVVHGAPAVVMYYDKDFRSAVYHVPAGLGRDMAPTMAVPFPRVLVVMSGTMTGTVGDDEFAISKGNLVFLPPDIPAQLWNDGDETLEFMFLMFGDGA
jgi:mannose-6-phosphate isomerase-like protein (cupin superfamily)